MSVCGEVGTLMHCWWDCKIKDEAVENSLAIPQKFKHSVTIKHSNIPRYISKRIENISTQKLGRKCPEQHH